MPYLQYENDVTLRMRDDEERTRNRTFRVNSIFTNTDDIADAVALMSRGTVDRYTYRQKQAFDGTLEIGDDGDVNDKTNLIFLDENQERVVVPLYDLEQSCFIAETGANARVVRDKTALAAETSPVPPATGTPSYYLNQFIDWVLDGTIIVASGQSISEYVEGYKVD